MSSAPFLSTLSLRGRPTKASGAQQQDPVLVVERKLSSRASSATLYINPLRHLQSKRSSRRLESAGVGVDGVALDLDGGRDEADFEIARGLLEGSHDLIRVPRRSSSFGALKPKVEGQVVGGEVEVWNQYAHRDSSARPLLTAAASMPTGLGDGTSFVIPSGETRRDHTKSSNTWSSSEGILEQEDREDREPFVQEYNRLAKKYGVPIIVPDGFEAVTIDRVTIEGKSSSWLMRKILKRTASTHQIHHSSHRSVKHKRSVSELPPRIKNKKDVLKDKNVDELIRLCGQSALWLPGEYAAGTLNVPTCFRATAQYLVQHAGQSRGIFRIAGSKATVETLYNHYAVQDDLGDIVDGTVRCPQLPDHIRCDVHDVATAFKRFLSGLPKGILGSTWLFDALVHIYGLLDSDPETTRTKQSKVRARLIALAIASITSRYERELLCGVFGLLCMVGRTAETSPREDDRGNPLPTSDLMGYQALGVTFGPLLIGELLDEHEVQAPPHLSKDGHFNASARSSGRASWRGKRKTRSEDDAVALLVRAEKFRLANAIAEMLIIHWRDVVRQMRNFGALKSVRDFQVMRQMTRSIRSNNSESFGIRKPSDWEHRTVASTRTRERNMSGSPTPASRRLSGHQEATHVLRSQDPSPHDADDGLSVRKQRAKVRHMSSQILSRKSISIMSPTPEETASGESPHHPYIRIPSDSTYGNRGRHENMNRPEKSEQMYPKNNAPTHGRMDGSRASAEQTKGGLLSEMPKLVISKSSTGAMMSRARGEGSRTTQRLAMDETISHQSSIQRGGMNEEDAIPMDWNAVVKPHGNIRSPKTLQEPIFVVSTAPLFKRSKTTQPIPQAQAAASTVPKGLVSSRVRGIAATDPGPQSSIRKKASHSTFVQTVSARRNAKTGLDTESYSPAHIIIPPKDPVASISQEDDAHGLTSLAEAINSEDAEDDEGIGSWVKSVDSDFTVDILPLDSEIKSKEVEAVPKSGSQQNLQQFKNDRLPIPRRLSWKSSIHSDASCEIRNSAMSYISASPPAADDIPSPRLQAPPNTPRSRPADREDTRTSYKPLSQKAKPPVHSPSKSLEGLSPAKQISILPVTPRRPFTDTQTPHSRLPKSTRTSVRALAARFNNVETTQSPVTSLGRLPTAQHSEKKVASPYTINRLPERTLRSSKSDRSLQSPHSAMTRPLSRRTYANTPPRQNTPIRDVVTPVRQVVMSKPLSAKTRGPFRHETSAEYARTLAPKLPLEMPGEHSPDQWPRLRPVGSSQTLRPPSRSKSPIRQPVVSPKYSSPSARDASASPLVMGGDASASFNSSPTERGNAVTIPTINKKELTTTVSTSEKTLANPANITVMTHSILDSKALIADSSSSSSAASNKSIFELSGIQKTSSHALPETAFGKNIASIERAGSEGELPSQMCSVSPYTAKTPEEWARELNSMRQEVARWKNRAEAAEARLKLLERWKQPRSREGLTQQNSHDPSSMDECIQRQDLGLPQLYPSQIFTKPDRTGLPQTYVASTSQASNVGAEAIEDSTSESDVIHKNINQSLLRRLAMTSNTDSLASVQAESGGTVRRGRWHGKYHGTYSHESIPDSAESNNNSGSVRQSEWSIFDDNADRNSGYNAGCTDMTASEKAVGDLDGGCIDMNRSMNSAKLWDVFDDRQRSSSKDSKDSWELGAAGDDDEDKENIPPLEEYL